MLSTRLIDASATDRFALHVRPVAAVVALLWALVAVGLYRGSGWATWIWPWADAEMTYIFLSSIAAAVAAPLAWIVIVDEPAAIAGMAIDGVVIGSAMTAVIAVSAFTSSDWSLLVRAIALAAAVAATFMVFRVTHPWPHRDPTPQTQFVRWYFRLLIAVLIPVGTLLMIQTESMFPWDLPGRTSSMIGGVFIGAASYFVYGLWRGIWVHAGGQLAGFLAYSLVLGIPYWRTVFDRDAMSASGGYQSFPGQVVPGAQAESVNETSLFIYTAVITAAFLVSCWYLFVNPPTRIRWGGRVANRA